MTLEYLGPKPTKTVKFPIPYVQHSAEEGSVTFIASAPGGPKVADVPEPFALKLLELQPEHFRLVSNSKVSEPKPSDPKPSAPKAKAVKGKKSKV